MPGTVVNTGYLQTNKSAAALTFSTVSPHLSEWLRLLPFLGVLALLGYLAVRPFLPKKKQQKDSLINLKIQKENPKVVNEINIEDLCLTKAAYCRCWRSKTFPACDGSHNKHNELTGDNVGPLILKKKEV
ncbi:CDGSH iron-sulfur domain-containing protein 2 isoform X2 [Pipistrellus kuhlii]|uniref:CDGSH iron-sulfur domain-containing protein 2 isoform X2 n=1 Tax=Pipistrellus kuhlii TaxID=59472 RepID=UPI00174F68BE|nr:CDGSH iron-sulfur domain-containing protein 2 isoform X2 [Pipistrellus kuhlii]